jgi:transposase
MYLRHSRIRRNGKTHTYWRLVRSVRRGGKVRQEIVAHLGELDARGRAKASALARHFLGEKSRQLELFDDGAPSETVPVRLDRVRAERTRVFGDVWLGWLLWQALGLDDFCREAMPEGREGVPWGEVASILVLARLCEPSSELHIAEDWYRRTALEDLLGVGAGRLDHTRLYRGLDRLLPHKSALEAHLKRRFGELFAIDYDLLLYDVTSTYFEGEAASNPQAKRGYSRDQRPDCKQVCIGLVVTRDGYPLGYEVFDGNRVDVTTVEEMVGSIEARYGKAGRIWVMDRGMVSEDNLSWMREGGRRYLVGTPKSELRKWEKELVEKRGWKEVREGLEVKICAGPEGAESFLLCRSAERKKKEEGMHERFRARIARDLERLARRIERARRAADRGQVERQIGRMLERNRRASGSFEVKVLEDKARPSGLRLDWKEDERFSAWARLTEGTYILRSNVTGWTPEELWRTYIQLTEAEAAFRVHKSELSIRPIWHQREDRVQAHILVCFLAFALWKTLEGWQERARLGSSPRTVLEEMRRIVSVDVVLPVRGGPELRLRCVVRPGPEQAALLDRLGLELPQRLRIPAPVAEM